MKGGGIFDKSSPLIFHVLIVYLNSHYQLLSMSHDKQIVIKNKILINISSSATLAQRRLFNVILHKVYNDLGDFSKQYFYLSAQELIELLGGESKANYQRFLEDCKALVKTVITWNVLETDKGLEQFSISALISSILFDQGTLKIELPGMLREKLVENNQYIKFNLQLQNKFSSKYSLVIYELCKEFYREKEKVGESPWFSIENIKQLVGVDNNEYSNFKDFNKWVLKVAEKEINRDSDISISFSYLRRSRKITHIKFTIKQNTNQSLEPKVKTETSANVPSSNDSKISNELLSFGVAKNKVEAWLENYPEQYLQSKLDLVLEKTRQGTIKTSPTGFLVKAIESNFDNAQDSLDQMVKQVALEARKLNPETVIVDPSSFDTQESFDLHIKELQDQFFTPKWMGFEFD